MEFYTNSRPNLISTRVRKKVKILANTYTNSNKNINGGTINSSFDDFLQSLYKNYIEPNKIILVFIISVTLFAWYRIKQKKLEREKEGRENEAILEQFVDDEPGNLQQIIYDQTRNIKYKEQPTLNPLFPVDNQYTEEVNYPPTAIPMNLDGQGLSMVQNNAYPREPFPTMIDPKDNYDYPYTSDTRNYYSGMNNSYKNAQDTTIQNPLGFSNNFNTSTGAFIGQNVDLNQNAFQNYNQHQQDTHADLTNTLQHGPAYLNQDEPHSQMLPPYSTEI